MHYHLPVLLNECLDGLSINPEGTYVDVTYGGGGHSKEILNRLTTGKLYAFDQDADAHRNKSDSSNLTLIKHNFRFLKNFLRYYNAIPVDGILADLGVSSHQFDTKERGFSTRFDDAELDMRMNTKTGKDAAFIINNYNEQKLQNIFKEYGEIKNAKQLARALVESRTNHHISTVGELKSATKKQATKGKENKYYAQVFQALRIEVNEELKALKKMLSQSIDVLKPGGRLVVMSYHSLEDKLVKNLMKSGNLKGDIEQDFFGNKLSPFNMITKKPIAPTDNEVNSNPRARSAKLRIAEKV